MLELKPRSEWTEDNVLDVAYLIVCPETNGGTESDLTLLDVAARLTLDLPAWAVWEDGLVCFVVGLIPFNGKTGVLHLAGTRMLSHEQHVSIVRGFLSSVENVQVYTLTDKPAIARLARQVGLSVTAEQDGQLILGRASQGV